MLRGDVRRILLVTALAVITYDPGVAYGTAPLRPCRARPPHGVIDLPKTGFRAIGDAVIPAELAWKTDRYDERTLAVAASGKNGVWDVVLAVSEKDGPRTGVCLRTKTNGDEKGRAWIEPGNEYGKPMFVLWDSFDAGDRVIGLVGWVYKPYQRTLVLDPNRTRALAKTLASSYRAGSPRVAAELARLGAGSCLLEPRKGAQ